MKKVPWVFKRAVVLTVIILAITLSASPTEKTSGTEAAKNVILFIGDGMGLAQVESATLCKYGQQLDEGGEPMKLSFEGFPAFGCLTTFSATSLVTDSAAAGTALACGVKTSNTVIGLCAEGKKAKTMGELAKARGKAVGIISSVGLDHATPASFYAHVDSRRKYDEIVAQFFQSRTADVLMGAGIYGKEWTPEKVAQEANKAGYRVFTCENFDRFTPEMVKEAKVFGYFDTNGNYQLDYEATREADCREPHLSELTIKTLQLLKRNTQGFFLMVESGSIDWACHENKPKVAIGEVLELDRTVADTLGFLAREGLLEETLIMVTADHETGGMTIPGPYGKCVQAKEEPQIRWSCSGHTALPVPIWAQGPGSHKLIGKHDNTFLFKVVAATLK